jgi:Skp family chaperone for outer membrane proteins
MKNKLVTIGALLLAATSICISVYAMSGKKQLAHFDYNEVYNDCTLKKTLEKDLESVVSSRKSELDSLQLELSFLSTKIQGGQTDQEELNRFENMKNRYLTFQERYEQENIRLKENYYAQIRTEINEKAREYAEENGYDYFFSAVGDGSLMYAVESDDKTKEFMNFLDKK